ncbi:MAG: S-layer family protein [Richelia sp. RM2_1_2]|nr:S-layer family protein [Richelia sp. RM2_1_2]
MPPEKLILTDSASGIVNLVGTDAQGNSGDININAGSFNLENGAEVTASTLGKGNAGNVRVTAKNAISVSDAYIFSTLAAGGVGKGGNIEINGATLSLQNGAQLLTAVREAFENQPAGKGDAGNVNVNISGVVDVSGSRGMFPTTISTEVQTGTEGNGGDININAGSFNLGDEAEIVSSTSGKGNAGNVTLSAKDTVSFTGGNIFSTVDARGVGKGGNININAANLSIRDGSQLLTGTSGASDSQMISKSDAGNVNINSGLVDIIGVKNRFPSGIRSRVGIGTEGNGGNITVNASSFNLGDGAEIITSTSGKGNAGNVTLTAKTEVLLSGSSTINTDVRPSAIGNGADINIQAQNVYFTNDAKVDTNSFGQGNSGNIQIKADDSIFIFSGARLSSSTFGQGKAGNVDLEVGNLAHFDGFGNNGGSSSIFSLAGPLVMPTQEFAIERTGGDVSIKAGSVRISNGAVVSTSAFGPGKAGNISIDSSEFLAISGKNGDFESGLYVNSESLSGISGNVTVNSPRITLDNQGILNAESTSGNGGNINLISNLLLMRRQAQIFTNAGTAQQSGNGGNIDINSTFVTAIPGENSDITTNSFAGKGGRIDVTAQGIFGLEIRDRLTPFSDITAFSELSPTLNGEITLNTPNVDPSQGTIELPQTIIDPDALIAQNPCLQRGGSEFIVTGKGGIPLSPNQVQLNAVEVDLIEPAPLTTQTQPTLNFNHQSNPNLSKIVPAQGWVVEGNEVILTADAVNGTTVQPKKDHRFSDCRAK